MKFCPVCGVTKPLSEFCKDRSRTAGHDYLCKTCKCKKQGAFRDANRERLRAQHRASFKKRYAENRTHHAEWCKLHPDRRAAEQKLQGAVRRGAIIRPRQCSRCGSPKPQGHHPDYTKPLDVIWLCRAYHYKEHRRIEAAAQKAG